MPKSHSVGKKARFSVPSCAYRDTGKTWGDSMKTVLITGAASGIGRAACEELAARGYRVVACDINEAGLQDLRDRGGEAIVPVFMDITKDDTVAAAYERTRAVTDTLDAVINCAGISRMGSLAEDDPAVTQRVIDINLLGMMRVNKAFFPLLRAGNGRIITISSECGRFSPSPFNGPYTISKFAVEAYNDTLRRELNYLGLKVIKIQPGSFKTNMHIDTRHIFAGLKENSALFGDILVKLEKIMEGELKHANDPRYLTRTIVRAIESKNPKMCYRVKNSKKLGLLSCLPESLIDRIYVAYIGGKK